VVLDRRVVDVGRRLGLSHSGLVREIVRVESRGGRGSRRLVAARSLLLLLLAVGLLMGESGVLFFECECFGVAGVEFGLSSELEDTTSARSEMGSIDVSSTLFLPL
jgi:hypothetical protein